MNEPGFITPIVQTKNMHRARSIRQLRYWNDSNEDLFRYDKADVLQNIITIFQL